jgi:hypothetical protein
MLFILLIAYSADGYKSLLQEKRLIAVEHQLLFPRVEANFIGNSSGLKTVISAGFSAELRQQ